VKARDAVTPIVLVVLAGGTAAYAYFVDRGAISDADRAARRADVFPSFRVEEVTRIELEHGGESLVLARGADAGVNGAAVWTMTSPRHEQADGAEVDALLRELELATRVRDVDAAEAAGLDATRVRGKVKVGPLEYRFEVGADAPRPDGAAYMRLDGERTFVVGRSLKVQLLRTADAYRDRTLDPYGSSEVARVDVGSPAGAFAIERHGTTFRVTGAGLRASRAATERLFGALADARAERFVDDAQADAASSPPAFTIRVAPQDASRPPVQLRVGGACPGEEHDVVVVRTSPARVSACVAKSLVDTLRATPEALVDTSPLYAHADEIEELRLEPVGGGGGPRIDLARHGAGWHERSPEDRDLGADESESANTLAAALASARASDAHEARADERVTPRARATVIRTGGGTTEVVELSAPGADGDVLVHRMDDGAVLHLPLAAARRFEPHPVALRARPVWRPAFDPGAVVAIDDTCGPMPQHLELRDHVWTMRAPAGFVADPVAAADLAGAVAHAKADAWIAEADDGGFGLGRPGACSVTLVLEAAGVDAAPRSVELQLGAEGDGGYYARTQGDPAVFVAPGVLRALASHPAIDRGRFRIDPASLASVTLVRGGERRTLAHDSEDDQLSAALSALYAVSALHPGRPAADEGFEHPTLEIDATARADGGAHVDSSAVRITIGAPTTVDTMDVYFARVSGVDATFAVPRQVVKAIVDAW
jgi:hypothetical protein